MPNSVSSRTCSDAALGIVLSPAIGAALMGLSTVIVAVNARLLRFGRSAGASS
jgi:cation transport ATPase